MSLCDFDLEDSVFSLAASHQINEIDAFLYYNTDGSFTLHSNPIFVAIHSLSGMHLPDN